MRLRGVDVVVDEAGVLQRLAGVQQRRRDERAERHELERVGVLGIGAKI